MNELLALLGQHWRLLLVYPGGMTALGALVATSYLLPRQAHWRSGWRVSGGELVLAALWLLLIALLPLPQTGWPYGLDLLAVVLLIELPFWVWLRRQGKLSACCAAALLNSYPLLVLALAMLGQAAGSLVVREINRSTGPLHWLGVAAWALVLPPLLGLGPWRAALPPGFVAAVRALAHVALLVAVALPAHDATPRSAALAAFTVVVLSLSALQRWWHGDPRRWTGWQPWIVGGLTLLSLIWSAQQFAQRLG